jgi:hypothetical protein
MRERYKEDQYTQKCRPTQFSNCYLNRLASKSLDSLVIPVNNEESKFLRLKGAVLFFLLLTESNNIRRASP